MTAQAEPVIARAPAPPPRARLLVLDPIDADALGALALAHDVLVHHAPTPEELPALVADREVVVVRSGCRITAEVFAAAPLLKLVLRAGSGTDNIDLDAARRHGVRVCNTPGGSANAVAELALGLVLAVSRHIALADRQVRAGRWRKSELAGAELAGKVLGVVGHGAIGSRLAELGGALGMSVVTSVDRAGDERRAELAARGARLVDLPELLASAHVVALAVPLTDRTRGLIGPLELRAMRRDAVLVNVSRGGVVDEDALAAALAEGVIAGAGVDVHARERQSTPLAGLDNAVLTPHIGAMSSDAQRRIGERVVADITAVLTGGEPSHPVC
ncbi:NAD(P)-dependent oxidoreductase [Actinosynnema pretiosum]|uniref:3-phosphoglycerate dehydrogenase n=1 Tax=Actinosynnema pretiosum TaxID=42197 RepID=A0A290Z705_9PSEU|nr:NAD(P)-dependent oxidoreductase [Actinosynnema pretiosum]ATE54752.1 3-phosphoglycerate dehydrogenase [Actinosynnema pretiosum]